MYVYHKFINEVLALNWRQSPPKVLEDLAFSTWETVTIWNSISELKTEFQTERFRTQLPIQVSFLLQPIGYPLESLIESENRLFE